MATKSTDATISVDTLSKATRSCEGDHCRRPSDDVGVTPDDVMAEVTELALEEDDEDEMFTRENFTTVLVPKCDRCVVYQKMCIDALKSMQALSIQNAQLEELQPQCELLKKQVAESQMQVEENLQAEHVLKARAETAEAEAAQAKEKFDNLEKEVAAMSKAAEEGKKHAHEANTWRVKYERTVELSKKIQEKRKADMENFEKVLNLANGYCMQAKHLQADHKSVKKDIHKLSKLVKTYVPALFNVLKHAMSSPFFKTEMPRNLQLEAERLCTGDVEKAFEFDLPDNRSEMEEGSASELERLVGGAMLSRKVDESQLSREPSSSAPMPLKAAKTIVRRVQESPSSVVESSAKAAAPVMEHVATVIESSATPPELVEVEVEQLGDEEADALLEAGAEAITMPLPHNPTRGRGRGRGRGRRGRGAKQTHATLAQPPASEVFPSCKHYEEILESKLRRKGDHLEAEASSSGVKHMSIHGKKTMSIREQQEVQMRIPIREKVALMKKKEQAKRSCTFDDNEANDAGSLATTTPTTELVSATHAKSSSPLQNAVPIEVTTLFETPTAAEETAEERYPENQVMEDFSIAREDLLLSASPSPASSVLEGEGRIFESEDIVLMQTSGSCDYEGHGEGVIQPKDDGSAMVINAAARFKAVEPAIAEELVTAQMDTRVPIPIGLVENLVVEGDVPIDFMDQAPITGDGGEIHKDGSVFGEVSQRAGLQAGVYNKLSDATKLNTSEADNTKEPRGTGGESVLDVDQSFAKSSVRTPAQSPIQNTEIAAAEERLPVVEKSTPFVFESSTSIDEMEKKVVLSGPEDGNREVRIAFTPSANEAEPGIYASGESEQSTLESHLADDTKRAIGFGRRLHVDLEVKLTPIHHQEDVEGAVAESAPIREEVSSLLEVYKLCEEERVHPSGSAVEKVNPAVEGTLEKACEVTQEPCSSSSSKRQPSARCRLSANDHDLAMQLHAQLNRRSLRSRRDSESDLQHLESTISSHEDLLKLGRRNKRTLSESQRSTEAQDNFFKAKTGRKTMDSDFFGDILCGARGSPPQEKNMIEKEATPTTTSGTNPDLLEEILVGARSAMTLPGRNVKSKKVGTRKKVLPTRHADPASNFVRQESTTTALYLASQKHKRRAAITPNDAETETTAREFDRAELVLKTDTERKRSHLLVPSLINEALEIKGSSSAAHAARRTRRSSTDKGSAGSVETQNNDKTLEQEDMGVSQLLEQREKTRSKPGSGPKKTVVLEALPKSATGKGNASTECILSSARRSRAMAFKTDAAEKLSEGGATCQLSSRTGRVVPRQRRMDERSVYNKSAESRKETVVSDPSSTEGVHEATKESLKDAPSSRDTTRTVATKTRRIEQENADATASSPIPVTCAQKMVKNSVWQLDSRASGEPPSDGPPARVTRRTGPLAPRKRRFDEASSPKAVSAAEEPELRATTPSLDEITTPPLERDAGTSTGSEKETPFTHRDSDDEDRLCVAEFEAIEEAEQLSLPIPKSSDDYEEHLVIDNNDEECPAVDDEEGRRSIRGVGESETEKANAVDKRQNEEVIDNEPKGSDIHQKTKASSLSELAVDNADEKLAVKFLQTAKKGVAEKIKQREAAAAVATHVVKSKSNVQKIGALGAARRSVPHLKSGPVAMQKFNATLSKQLRKGRQHKVETVKKPLLKAISATSELALKTNITKSPSVSLSSKKASTTQKATSAVAITRKDCKRKRSAASVESQPPLVKRPQFVESSVQKQLQGALLSEQKIEVIRKNLADCLDDISNMHPQEFASAMATCSLNLHSGDMWAIIQKNFRNCDSSDIHNTKEDTFLYICSELGGSAEIWLHYVEKMKIVFSTQTPNPIYTGRYIRLFIRALRETGDLVSWDEKKKWLRTVLMRIFLEDIGVAIKATTYALLTPYYDLLDWMKDRNDPFSFLLSLAVTTAHMEGKVLLWAWFQQFAEELPLQDVSAESVTKAFDDLVTNLDNLAKKRGQQTKNDTPIPTTGEENALVKMASAYLSPANGCHVSLKKVLDRLVSDCVSRVKKAMNPRALVGETAWSEVYMVSNRSHLFIAIVMCTFSWRDDPATVHDFCNLLRERIPLIRETRDELAALETTERPWIDIYRGIIDDVVKVLQVFARYEI